MAMPYPLPEGSNRKPAPAAGQALAGPGPETYVLLPRLMVEDLRRAPGAIGAYALIGRLYLVSGAPVPLSPGDLQAYDPTLSYGGARRALDSLALSSYALRSEAAGRKSTYVPTWGVVKGSICPWEREAPVLGRPRHVGAVRLDDRLLDLCIGRLRPSTAHRAIIDRYVARPLLGLRDVGAYALGLTGVRHSSENLRQLGLFAPDGAPLPLPDDLTVLAVASQRAPAEALSGLTPEGLQRAGFSLRPAPAPTGRAIFFVPRAVVTGAIAEEIGGVAGEEIGDLSARVIGGVIGGGAGREIGDLSARVIGGVIGSEEAQKERSEASQSQKADLLSVCRRSHGITDGRIKTNQPTNTSSDHVTSGLDPQMVGGGDEIVLEAGSPTAGPGQSETAQTTTTGLAQGSEVSRQGGPTEQAQTEQAKQAPTGRSEHSEVSRQGGPTEQAQTEQAEQAPTGRSGHSEVSQQGDPTEQAQTEQAKQAQTEQAPTGRSGPSAARRRGRAVPPAQAEAEQPRTAVSAQTESERQLRAIGVRVDTARKFADRPAAQITRVIAQARGRQDVRDVPAWVIGMLKALPPDEIPHSPEDDLPPPPFPIYDHPSLTTDQRSDWLMAYHRAQTPAQKRDLLARFEQEHPFSDQGLPRSNKVEAPSGEELMPMNDEIDPSPYLIYAHKGITQRDRELWLQRFFGTNTSAAKRIILEEFEQKHPLVVKGDPGSGQGGHTYWWIRPGPNRLKVHPGSIFSQEGLTNVERMQWAYRFCCARTKEEKYAVLVDFERAHPPTEAEQLRVVEERRPTGDQVFGPRSSEPPAVELMLRRPGPTDEQRTKWITKFRMASTPDEQVDVLFNFEQEYPR